MMKRNALRWLQVALLLAGMIIVGVSPALADLSATPREATWGTNGPVYAIATANGVTYLGGSFSYVGPYTGSFVSIDASTGQSLTTFPKVNGSITCCVPDSMGGWYIGGWFTQVGALARNGLAHILADGTVDAVWNPSANGGFVIKDYDSHITALAVSGSMVYVGGRFTRIGGQTRNNIAALNAITGAVTDWNPNASAGGTGYIKALVVSGSTVYAGGNFSSIGGQPRNYLAALDATTGAALAWNPSPKGGYDNHTRIHVLAVSGSTIYVGGDFISIGGQERPYFAQFDILPEETAVKDWRMFE